MMRELDIKLYKMAVREGQEDTAEEWLAFLEENKEEFSRIIQEEHSYLVAYFTSVEKGTKYWYLFLASKDIAFTQNLAAASLKPVDIQHFDFKKRCINPEEQYTMDCRLYLENLNALFQ